MEEVARVAAAVGLRPIRYRGLLVAAASAEHVYLVPDVARLRRGDPLRRFIATMCLYRRDVDTGALPGPYDDAVAELYARCVLIPDDDFRGRGREPDPVLADHFRVPVGQIAAK